MPRLTCHVHWGNAQSCLPMRSVHTLASDYLLVSRTSHLFTRFLHIPLSLPWCWSMLYVRPSRCRSNALDEGCNQNCRWWVHREFALLCNATVSFYLSWWLRWLMSAECAKWASEKKTHLPVQRRIADSYVILCSPSYAIIILFLFVVSFLFKKNWINLY